MARLGVAVHVVTTRREYKGKTYSSHLLRRSYREGDKVKNETVGNLSHLPDHVVELIRLSLKGQAFSPAAEAFEITASAPHGHVQAVRTAMRQLGFEDLLAARPCPERALVMAMVTARIVAPQTKLATTRWWHTSTLAEDLGVAAASEDDLYAAMDWLLARQESIEKKLVARHLHEDSLVLYDLSSSYFEGEKCPLAKLGHNRDGKKGKLQVNYGLVTDARGCPVAVSVFEGDTADCKTVVPQVRRIQADFGIEHLVIVGDRGMISQKAIDEFKRLPGVAWITAMKSAQIRALADEGGLQMGLFDERNGRAQEAPRRRQNRRARGARDQQIQGRQALRAEDRESKLELSHRPGEG